MNRIYGALLALLFCFGVGAFQVARGWRSVRLRGESTLLGFLRILLGAFLMSAPLAIYLYFRRGARP